VLVFLAVLIACVVVGYAYIRRRWLQYLRHQILMEISEFVGTAHDFDAAAAGALMLVQEVELVSRGYRMSAALLCYRSIINLHAEVVPSPLSAD